MKKEELHDQLLTDRSFQACTNQNLRRQYAEDLWFEPENKWLRLVFKDKYSSRSNRLSDSFVNFIERTYNEYKLSKKK